MQLNVNTHVEAETRVKYEHNLTVGIVQITDSSRDDMTSPLPFVTHLSCSAIISEYAWHVLKIKTIRLLPSVVLAAF